MISQIRDHGVFTAPPPVTAVAATLNRNQIAAQKSELDARLSPLLEKIQAGSATPEEMILVTDLAEDSRLLTDRLRQAEVALAVAEEKQARAHANARRDRFEQLIVESRRKRSEFARLYREACVVLGGLCSAVDEASSIANSFAASTVAGMLPTDRNAVMEMSERIDPLAALLDAGLSPVVGFGWDFRIAVVPLKGKI